MFFPIVTISPTVTGSTSPAYSAGDNVGGKLTLPDCVALDRPYGEIVSVVLASDSVQTIPFDLFLFHSDPSGSTFTDNAAQDIVVADLSKSFGVIHLNDISSLSGASIHQAVNIVPVEFRIPSGTSLYAALVARGAMTLAATSDLKLNVFIRQQQ